MPQYRFSVLMSLYFKEKPDYLRQSLDSVFNQTLPPTEVILVKDGPLTPELDAVVNEFSEKHSELKVIPLKQNSGLGRALNAGLRHCSYELVARMDTDDICMPTRFERQIKFMEENPTTDVCGAWINEFIDSPDNIVSQRRVPAEASEIKNVIKRGCPFNHPTVVFRKSAIENVGGYRDFYLLEDWYLWARLVKNNAVMTNLREPLLLFRTTKDMYKRRGGYKYAKSCIRLLRELKKMKLVNGVEYVVISSSRFVISMMPNFLRKHIYSVFRLIQK